MPETLTPGDGWIELPMEAQMLHNITRAAQSAAGTAMAGYACAVPKIQWAPKSLELATAKGTAM